MGQALTAEFTARRTLAAGRYGSVKSRVDRVHYDSPAQWRKAYALEFTKPENKEISPILFAFLDGKDVDAVVWKQVKSLTSGGSPLRDAQFT